MVNHWMKQSGIWYCLLFVVSVKCWSFFAGFDLNVVVLITCRTMWLDVLSFTLTLLKD